MRASSTTGGTGHGTVNKDKAGGTNCFPAFGPKIRLELNFNRVLYIVCVFRASSVFHTIDAVPVGADSCFWCRGFSFGSVGAQELAYFFDPAIPA